MSLQIVRAILLAGLFCSAAFAQLGGEIWARVPFDFQIGKTKLPAGYYSVTELGQPGSAILIYTRQTELRRGEAPSVTMALVMSRLDDKNYEEPTLVFSRYPNGRTFLSAVRVGRTGVQLLRSRDEIVTSTLSASARPEVVMIMARYGK